MLHLDPAGSYGSHWASHRLDGLLDWAAAQQQRQSHRSQEEGLSSGNGSGDASSGGGGNDGGSDGSAAGQSPAAAAGADPPAAAGEVAVPAEGAAVYSHVSVRRDAEADVGAARDFSIDLAAKARPLKYTTCCCTQIDCTSQRPDPNSIAKMLRQMRDLPTTVLSSQDTPTFNS